jgi:ribosomal protein S18 acetylase RimI-like enzyme
MDLIMQREFKIRDLEEKDWPKILTIVKKLRGWFDNVALTFEIPNDLKFHNGFVAVSNGAIVGFLSYSSLEGEVFISWIGVDPDFQKCGIGSSLIQKLEKILLENGIDKLKVETLSENVEYKPYEKTRSFYKKLGFTKAEYRKTISKETKEEIELVTFRKNIK